MFLMEEMWLGYLVANMVGWKVPDPHPAPGLHQHRTGTA